MTPRRVLILFTLALSACGTPGADRWNSSWNGAYGRFEKDERTQFTEAREYLDRGDRLGAHRGLSALLAQDPDNLEVGAWLQDIEVELLKDGVDLYPDAGSLDGLAADDVLRREYARRADVQPTVASFVLAARAETDVIAAETLLGKALELDPTCAWAHYGRSHVLLQDRSRTDRWGIARGALDRSLELDPGHLRARRLESWMAAQEGSRNLAEAQLSRWIEVARDDPRVARKDTVEAHLDLVLLLLLRGEDSRALKLLEDLEGEVHARGRRLVLLTVARQEGGDALGALDAALRAQGAMSSTTLPLVQEALLHELFLDRPDLARERWKDVARLSEDTSSVADLIQGLRARVRLERAAAKEPEMGPPAGDDPGSVQ